MQRWQEVQKERTAKAEQQATEVEQKEQATPRYNAADLTTFATALLQHAGLAEERVEVVADFLLEADLMGHSTHGLQLLAP